MTAVNPKKLFDQKPLELKEGIDMAISALFEKIATLEKRMNEFENKLKEKYKN